MKYILIMFIICVNQKSFSKTLVISDIDDTLKVSHVKSRLGAIGNAFNTKRPFLDSSELFKFLSKEVSDVSFFYVSNAPSWLMKRSHQRFIKRNRFPDGEIFLKREYSSEEHKIKTILKIITENNPNRVILLGDNGQKDIVFYDYITNELAETHPHIKIIQFIHHVYEDSSTIPLRIGQIPYVSSLGILSALISEFNIRKDKLKALAVKLSKSILAEKRGYHSFLFPVWYQCEDYRAVNNIMDIRIVEEAFEHIQNGCAS